MVPKRFTVNLFGTLWTQYPERIDAKIINHERIHTAQMRELLFVPFYVLYFIEWLVRLIQYRNWFEAYKNISFEREAYTYDHDLNYIERRSLFSWISCLRR
ncbi:MAG: hypothetical protein J1E38_08375 [Paramuribaculum sp.]|nr:hypothetical protein [Paramuribaculum sp.]